MKRSIHAFCVAIFLVALGCVVIPDTFEARITIDIRHVEAQADDVLDYVEGKTDSVPNLDAPEVENTSYLERTLRFVMPGNVAYAADLDEGSPRAQQILRVMKERYPEVQALKDKGIVGETNRGSLELLKSNFEGSEEAMNSAQQVVAADNKDRKAFYQEIARINKAQNMMVSTVERVYAQKRLMRGQPGEHFQLPREGKDLDAFKSSLPGQKLGDACVADAWIKIPE